MMSEPRVFRIEYRQKGDQIIVDLFSARAVTYPFRRLGTLVMDRDDFNAFCSAFAAQPVLSSSTNQPDEAFYG